MIDKYRSEGTSSATPEDPDKSTPMSFLEYVKLYGVDYDRATRKRIIATLSGNVVRAENIGFDKSFVVEPPRSDK